jgi:dihydropteroate synthase
MENSQTFFLPKDSINCSGKLINLNTPKVMGIINVSRDSFYRGSQFMMKRRIVRRAKEIIGQGGHIIDIGACSTRPGSEPISENEELKRLDKAVGVVRKHFPDSIISVDTFRASVAKRMVENFRVNIINDISAGDMDADMFDTISKLNVPYIVMHMKGTPKNMQDNPTYENIIREIFNFFTSKVNKLNLLGVNDILLDPGFGFGKSVDHNYTILNNLDSFKIINLPIVVGLSRKSMIYKPLEITPDEALNGTTALNTIALQKGAKILRVHDVKQAIETIKLVNLTQNQARFE